jgi:hypothetical protein
VSGEGNGALLVVLVAMVVFVAVVAWALLPYLTAALTLDLAR